ncbi:MAG: 2-oxoacid:acceptor oxidoreductase subunit alpha [Candidatus Diapherotrites archaeon]|nr:2-oxoacid:acceptor oxidoreductase subunit alpha [Candidatus Diapherotrites archaeon]
MRRSVLIGGQAGQGVAKAAEVLGKILVKLGYYVFNYRDYPSLIRGGHNFNVVTFSGDRVFSHDERGYEVIVALDQRTVKTHLPEEKKDTYYIAPKGVNIPRGENIDTSEALKEGIPPIATNVILLGALAKYLGIPKKVALEVIRSELKGEFNEKAFLYGYERGEGSGGKIGRIPRRGLYFLTGNEAIGLGAIASGIDMYIAYPMTPATPVLHFLAARKKQYDFTVLQLENEIAVVNAALGASYAGAIVMVGTSGGGFALMSEALSLQGMSEVPLVVYLAQRTGPSTGVPTYTAQADLLFALHAGHGEFPRVVVAPGDPAEAFERTMEAFYLAYRYRVLSILLGDKHLGESHYTMEEGEFSPRVKPERFLVFPEGDYKSYEITEDGVTPRSVPGAIEAPVRATSYEHDEYGITTEEGPMIEKMMEKRLRKAETVREAVMELEPLSVYGDPEADRVIVSWGSTKGAILDALGHLSGWKFVKINYIKPFPSSLFLHEVEDARRVVIVENSSTGQIGKVIAMETGFITEDKVLRYDARPFTPEYILRRLRG